MPNQRACDFADLPTEEEGGGTPKKVTQCKRVKFGGRRADPTRQYNTRRVQLGVNPGIHFPLEQKSTFVLFGRLSSRQMSRLGILGRFLGEQSRLLRFLGRLLTSWSNKN